MCTTEEQYLQFMAIRATLPPLTSGEALHWDGGEAGSQSAELTPDAAPGANAVWPVPGHRAIGCQAFPEAPTRSQDLLPTLAVPAIDWARQAASFIFYLDPNLLLPSPGHAVLPAVTGTLLWVQQHEAATGLPTVHPALLVQTAAAPRQGAYVELVPHLPCNDPLQHHSTGLLQAAVAAEDKAGRLYAEALANALAAHLLRRYAACRPPAQVCSGGFTPSRLQRTVAYIQTHLEHELSLSELAAVTQMSPSHFAHLFKQTTRQTPHQYVIMCRMERAKHLLTETTLSLHEIGAQVGYADQSHFTALFRRHMATTPRAYRAALGPDIGTPAIRFAHDSNMLRTNVTDGAGHFGYALDLCVMKSFPEKLLVPS